MGHARWPLDDEAVPFPGYGEAGAPESAEGGGENVTIDKMPKFEISPSGGGYYDLIEDGQVVQQVRGKKKADIALAQLMQAWLEENGLAENGGDEDGENS